MTQQELFKKAHELTAKKIQDGDSYIHVFGAALKTIRTEQLRADKMRKLRTFRVDFIKRTNGEARSMMATLDAPVAPKGAPRYDAIVAGVLNVWSIHDEAFRSVSLDQITDIDTDIAV